MAPPPAPQAVPPGKSEVKWRSALAIPQTQSRRRSPPTADCWSRLGALGPVFAVAQDRQKGPQGDPSPSRLKVS